MGYFNKSFSVRVTSRWQIERVPLPVPSAVISMCDPDLPPAAIFDQEKVVDRLHLFMHDTSDRLVAASGLLPPSETDAERILAFVRRQTVPDFVIQCEAGAGRSQGVAAALIAIGGGDPTPIFQNGTYNRRIYTMLLKTAGMPLPVEPRVSINVRIKYPIDRLHLFLLSMRRQRYPNWAVVAVTDGPNPEAVRFVAGFGDERISIIETPQRKGRWGHPYRQLGIDACTGEYIGMSNDDNYYVPGYIEQMVFALRNADLVLCDMLASGDGWARSAPQPKRCFVDLGGWIAKASLVKATPWCGNDFTSDGEYVEKLAALAKDRIAFVRRPLFVKN